MNETSQNWGKKLFEVLTIEQIQRLLDAVASSGILAQLDQTLRATDADLASTVRKLFAEQDKSEMSGAELGVSDQKTLETWDELWNEWSNHVGELGDEEGKYVIREFHWDAPYFDGSAFADDLEKLAEKMFLWIDRVVAVRHDVGLFDEELKEMSDHIRDYPEWMYGGERCQMGPRVTECVLKWTWLVLEDSSARGETFLNQVHALEQDCDGIVLDNTQCFNFFIQLPEDVRRAIHSCLRTNRYADTIGNPRSLWHKIHHHFNQEFDRPAYLQSCETHLCQDWRYGQPLIAEAIKEKDYALAESWIERTFASFLGGEERWNPEDGLLPPISPYGRPQERSDMAIKLLTQWEEIASKRAMRARLAACRLQRIILTSASDWPEVFRAFDQFQIDGKKEIAEKLFAEWQDRIVVACDLNNSARDKRDESSWIHRLILVRRDPQKHKQAFLDHLDIWFDCHREHPAFFEKQWRSLALLTYILPTASELKKRCPTFHERVLAPNRVEETLENR